MADNESTSVTKDLGIVSAYGYAKAAGYTGTEEEFEEIFLEFTENAPGLLDRLDEAVDDAEAAETAAAAANTAAQAAKTAAENAAATFETDTTLAVSGKAADAKVTGDEITGLKTALDLINGDAEATVTLFTGTTTPASGVTAKLENGKIVLYGTATAQRRWVCLNGQNISATTSTAFNQTFPAGIYTFDINITGTQTSENVNFVYTTSTFEDKNTKITDGEVLKTSVPIMVGLWIKKGLNYGTSDNPTYVDVHVKYYEEKASKANFDRLAQSNYNLYFRGSLTENNDLDNITASGWYYNTSSHVPSNAPFNTGFKYLVLYYNATTTVQMAFQSVAGGNVYYRTKTSSGWGEWFRVPKVDTRVLPTYNNISSLFTDGVLTAGTYTLKGYTSENSPIMVKMQSMYTTSNGSEVPYVTFESRTESGGRLYFSHKYEIDSNVEYKQQEWRIPNNFITDYVNIIITVPEGSTLAVKSFDCKYVPYVEVGNPKIIFHAHRGLEKFWPSETYNSVLAAAEMGFKSCIVIPKFTSDGVAVCFHNDGGSSSPLKAYLKEPDGTEVPELQDTSVKISDFTYAELMQWSMGVVKANAYADEKILKMDDFLAICAKTGMRPIFSIHPTLTADEWAALKTLVDKYGLANQLSVKDGDTITWTRVINAFGDGNIYSIICLSSTAIDAVSKISSWRTSASAPNTRVDVEWMNFDPEDSTYVTKTQEARAAGLIVSAVLDQAHTGNYIKACIENGITEFTNERHCSMGLNW